MRLRKSSKAKVSRGCYNHLYGSNDPSSNDHSKCKNRRNLELQAWHIIFCVSAIYHIVTVPYFCAFHLGQEPDLIVLCINYAFDVLYLAFWSFIMWPEDKRCIKDSATRRLQLRSVSSGCVLKKEQSTTSAQIAFVELENENILSKSRIEKQSMDVHVQVKYKHCSAVIEFVAALPYDLIGLVLSQTTWNTESSPHMLWILRLPRLLLILPLYSMYLPRLVGLFVGGFKTRDLNWTNIKRIVVLFCTVILTAHIFACLFFGTSAMVSLRDACDNVNESAKGCLYTSSFIQNCTSGIDYPDMEINSRQEDVQFWVEYDNLFMVTCTFNASSSTTYPSLLNLQNPSYQYIRSLYWAIITMITTGFGDIVPQNKQETLVTCFVIYTGLLLTLAVIANVTNFITDLEKNKSEHDKKLELISKYIATYQVSDLLKQNVRHYYQYKWESYHGFEPQREFSHFPHPIQTQLVGERSRKLLHKLEFIRQCPNRAFIVAVLESLAAEVMLPNDVILKDGNMLRDAHFLCQGECILNDVQKKQEIQVFDGKDMPIFGATCVIKPIAQKGELRARTFCEFMVLYGHRFQQLRREYLNAADIKKMDTLSSEYERRAKKMDKLFGLSSSKSTKRRGKCLRFRDFWKNGASPGSVLRFTVNTLLILGCIWYAIVIPLMVAFSFSDCPIVQPTKTNSTSVVGEEVSGISSLTINFTNQPSLTYTRNMNNDGQNTTLIVQSDNEVHVFSSPLNQSSFEWQMQQFVPDISNSTSVEFATDLDSSQGILFIYLFGNVWDICHLIDMVFRWRYYSFSRNGVSVYSAKLIATKYCRSRLSVVIDIIAALPIHLLSLFWNPRYYFLLRLVKFLYLLRFGTHIRDVLSTLTLKLNCIITSSVRRFMSLVSLVLLSSHIIGCGWIFVAYFSRCADDLNSNSSMTFDQNLSAENDSILNATDWIQYDMQLDFSNFDQTTAFIYLRAFYWALVAMTTVGYGDICAHNIYETIYATFALLFGGLIYPAIVGAVAVLLTGLDANSSAFRAKMGLVRAFMDSRQFPQQLKIQVISYFDYLWSTHGAIEENSVLKDLPPSLRKQIYCSVNRPALRAISMFDGCSIEFCNEVMSLMRSVVYLPGDLIIEIDEKAEHMYFIHQGIVRVYNRDETVVLAVLGVGSSFGEAALLQSLDKIARPSTNNSLMAACTNEMPCYSSQRRSRYSSQRTANVRAVTYCSCITLGNTEFKTMLDDWHQDREIILGNIDREFASKHKQNANVLQNFKRFRKLHSLASLNTQLSSTENSLAGLKSISAQHFRHHDSNCQHCWRTLQLFGVVYAVFVTPARIAFTNLVPIWCYFFDIIFDLLSFADMYLKDRVITFMERGEMHSNSNEIHLHYVKSCRFWCDLVACIPLDAVVALTIYILQLLSYIPNEDARVAVSTFNLLRLLKLSRLYCLAYWDDFEFFLQRYICKGIGDSVLKFVALLCAVIMISHWFASGFFLVARMTALQCDSLFPGVSPNNTATNILNIPVDTFEELNTSTTSNATGYYSIWCGTVSSYDWNKTWVGHQLKLELLGTGAFVEATGGNFTESSAYLRALNWALPTLVAVVVGDVIPTNNVETAYCVASILVGITINAAIIGNIASAVADLDGPKAVLQSKTEYIAQYLSSHHVSKRLKNKTLAFLKKSWAFDKGLSSKEFHALLPAGLKANFWQQIRVYYLKKTRLFSNNQLFPKKALAAVAQVLLSHHYAPGDVLYRQGEVPGSRMYFVKSGQVISSVVVDVTKRLMFFMSKNRHQKFSSLSSAVNCQTHITNDDNQNASNADRTHKSSPSGLFRWQMIRDAVRAQCQQSRKSYDKSHENDSECQRGIDETVAKYNHGQHFGEYNLFISKKALTTVRATMYSEILTLKREDLEFALSHMCEAFRRKHSMDKQHENYDRRVSWQKLYIETVATKRPLTKLQTQIKSENSRGRQRNDQSSINAKKNSNNILIQKVMRRLGKTATKIYACEAMQVGECVTKRVEADCRLINRSSPQNTQAVLNKFHRRRSRVVPVESVANLTKSSIDKSEFVFDQFIDNRTKGLKKNKRSLEMNQSYQRPSLTTSCNPKNNKPGGHHTNSPPSGHFTKYITTYTFVTLTLMFYVALAIPVRAVFWQRHHFETEFSSQNDYSSKHNNTWKSGNSTSVDNIYSLSNSAILIWLSIDWIVDVLFLLSTIFKYRLRCEDLREWDKQKNTGQKTEVDLSNFCKKDNIQGRSRCSTCRKQFGVFLDFTANFPPELICVPIMWDRSDCFYWISIWRTIKLTHLMGSGTLLQRADNWILQNPGKACGLRCITLPYWKLAKILILYLLINWSWYFTLSTMSSVGYGDILPRTNTETLFQLVVVLTGACLFAALVGSIGVLLRREDDKSDLEFRRKKAQLEVYFQKQNLPRRLVMTIQENFVAMWTTRKESWSTGSKTGLERKDHASYSTPTSSIDQSGAAEPNLGNENIIFMDKRKQQKFIRELPIGLRADIASECLRDVLHKVRYLRCLSSMAQRLIALELKVIYCLAGSTIYQCGDQARNVFFVFEGEAHCTMNNSSLQNYGHLDNHMDSIKYGANEPQRSVFDLDEFTLSNGRKHRKKKSILPRKLNNAIDEFQSEYVVISKSSYPQFNNEEALESKFHHEKANKQTNMFSNTKTEQNVSSKNSSLSETEKKASSLPSTLVGTGSTFRRVCAGHHFGHESLMIESLQTIDNHLNGVKRNNMVKHTGRNSSVHINTDTIKHGHTLRNHNAITMCNSTLYLIEISTLRKILETVKLANLKNVQESGELLERLSIDPGQTERDQ